MFFDFSSYIEQMYTLLGKEIEKEQKGLDDSFFRIRLLRDTAHSHAQRVRHSAVQAGVRF